jgi:apolipoprotein N-acyltransferase
MSIQFGLAAALIAFLLQLALLVLTENRALRLIPVYVLVLGALTALLCWLGILVDNDGGMINGGAIVAAVILIYMAFWIAGAALGALVWFIVKKVREKRSGETP